MPSSSTKTEPARERSPKDSIPVPLPALLSVSTLPVLMGILTLKSLGGFWQAIGQQSEEVFRGDRLPLLNHPELPSPSSNSEL